jgi:nucleoid-associated protein YgaU
MLPEMLYATAFKDKKLSEAAAETSKYVVDNFMPSFTPTAIKPVIELGANYSFFTGKPIESQRLLELEPGQRAYATTPEALKALGEATNISPVKMEYLLRTYTGSLPLALLSLANPVTGAGEAPEGRGALSSTTPVIGAFFQPKDANGLVDKAYKEMNEVIQAKRTYENYLESGRTEQAEEFMTKEADLIGMATFAGKFRKQMGDFAKLERMVRMSETMSAGQKRAELDAIRQAKIDLAKGFASARE